MNVFYSNLENDPFHSFMFLSFPELSASAQPSQIYSVSCSCHFRIFRFFSASAVSETNAFRVLAIFGSSGFPRLFRTPVSQLFLFTFVSFPDFSDLIRNGPAVTKLFSFLFLSFFRLSNVFRRFPDASDSHKIVPFAISLISVFFGFIIFRCFPDAIDGHKIASFPNLLISGNIRIFSDFCRMRPAATKLFPYMSFAFPYVSRFFRFCDVFPDLSDSLKINPHHIPLISGFFLIFQSFPDTSDRRKIISLPILICGFFPTFSDLFRTRPTAAKLFFFLILLFAVFPTFPTFLDASDRHKIVPLPDPLISGFSGFVRHIPHASRHRKIDRALVN